jgi:hypothetical protein
VHAPSELSLDFLKLHPHAVASGLPVKQEAPLTRFFADEDELQTTISIRWMQTSYFCSSRVSILQN